MGKSGFRHPTANDLRYHLPNDIDAILALDDRGRRTRRFGSRTDRRNDR
jgi:hypothetical protein